jgi:putative MFS transporter
MDTTLNQSSAAARINRLPIGPFHRGLMWLLGMVVFFDFADTNSFSFASPVLLKAWHLQVSTIAMIVSATFIGMFIGSLVGGTISDRIGRKRALVIATAWYAGFSLLNAFVWNTASLFTTRLLTGVGISAMTVVGMTYVSEMFPARRRGAYQAWIMTIGLCGIPITAYVARYCVPLAPWGWRLIFVWGSLGLVLLFFSGKLEESPVWHEQHGRFDEAEAVLARIEASAGQLDSFVLSESSTLQEKSSRSAAGHFRGRTVVLAIAWICQTLGFFGFTAWVPTLLVAHGFSIVHSLTWSSAMSIATVPGAAIASVISDRWDRKWWITIFALLIALSGLLYGLTFDARAIVFFGFLVEMFLHTINPLLYAYTAECYPTRMRNSGAGITYGSGRLANAFGPLLVAFLFSHYGYSSVFIYITGLWLMVAITIGAFGIRSRELVHRSI